MMNKHIDGHCDSFHIAGGDHTGELGTGDFTVEFYLPKGSVDLGKAAPDDGQWHHVGIQRGPCKTHVHGDEYIDGVMFSFVKTYGEDGKLETIQYTRADLVKGD